MNFNGHCCKMFISCKYILDLGTFWRFIHLYKFDALIYQKFQDFACFLMIQCGYQDDGFQSKILATNCTNSISHFLSFQYLTCLQIIKITMSALTLDLSTMQMLYNILLYNFNKKIKSVSLNFLATRYNQLTDNFTALFIIKYTFLLFSFLLTFIQY